MAIALTNRGRLAIKEQGSGWGTAETSFSATDYLEIDAPFVPVLPRETLEAETFRPGFTVAESVPGVKIGSLSWTQFLHGVSSTTPTDNPTIHPDALLFKAALGTGGADGYSATVTGGTAAIPTDSSIPTAHAGYAALYPLSSGYSVGWNSVVTGNTSSDLLVDLSASPAAGTALGSYVAWLTTAAATPLTLEWQGTDSTAKIRYYDALPSKLTLTLAAKQAPKLAVEMQFLNWANVGSGGAPSDYAYSYPRVPAFIGANGARVLFAGGSAVCATQVVIEITQVLEPADCASGDQGVGSLVVVDRQVRVSVTRNPTDYGVTPWTDTVATTATALQIDACTTPGRAFSFALPNPKIMSAPTPQGNGNLLGLTTVYGPQIYSSDTGTTAPADTAARAAFL